MSSLLTEGDIAERLRVSLTSVHRWRLEQCGPQFIKVGSLVRYRPEDLEVWLAVLRLLSPEDRDAWERAVAVYSRQRGAE